MTETTDTKADSTRQQILRAAARRFAQQPYHQVGLDDVLAEAELTKGAMYFHFRSKHALALAIIEDQTTQSGEAVADLLTRKLSGLETLIDFSYQLAVRDISEDIARAGLHLLESIGRIEGLQAEVARGMDRDPRRSSSGRAIDEGDIVDRVRPAGCGTSARVDIHGAAPDQQPRRTGAVSPRPREDMGVGAGRHRASGTDRLLHPIHQATHGNRDREYLRTSGFKLITTYVRHPVIDRYPAAAC